VLFLSVLVFSCNLPLSGQTFTAQNGISIGARLVSNNIANPAIKPALSELKGGCRVTFESDYFPVCPITSGSTGVPSACTASSAAGSSPNA